MERANPSSEIGAKADTWNRVAASYPLEIATAERALASEIIGIFKRAGVDIGSQLLEVGSGSGHLSLAINQAGYKTDMLDFAEDALSHAKLIFQKFDGSPDSRFLLLDALNFDPTPLPKYDLAWNSGVCEHFSNESLIAMLRNMSNVSRNVCIVVPNPSSVFYLAGKRAFLDKGIWPYGTELQRDNYEKLIEAAGLAVTRHGYIGKDLTADWISNALGHTGTSIFHKLLDEGQIPPREYYLQFFWAQKTEEAVSNVEIDDAPTLDKTFYLDAMGTATAMISHLNHANAVLEKKLQGQDQTANERLELSNEIERKINEITQKDAVISNIERSLLERDKTLDQLRSEIVDKNNQIENLKRHITSLMESTSWRLTSPMRYLVNKIRK
ncbi:methyltransferase [Ochrobactrum sp. 3-3]|uniref:class I SAM-dependent methyltransferase n=1 Tax=Ochrobactrum sp. 3-3 TaxID=1830124 RepID=UPI0013B39E19|nr:methyltransferase [Ochrobactrum sp. 3-3]